MRYHRDIVAIYNPSSTRAITPHDIKDLFHEPRLIETSPDFERSRDEIARAVEPGNDVISFGGDGTTNLVINAIHEHEDVRYMVAPYGNGNDGARNLHRNRGLSPVTLYTIASEVAVRLITTRLERGTSAQDRLALTYAGIGWTARFAEKLNQPTTREHMLYRSSAGRLLGEVAAALSVARESAAFGATIDGQEQRLHELLFANGRHVAKFGALPTDLTKPELFYLPFSEERSTLVRTTRAAQAMGRVVLGTLGRDTYLRGDEHLSIDLHDASVAHLDAEPLPLQPGDRLTIGVSPQPLRLLSTRYRGA